MSKTLHADFYTLKGLVVSSHPELLELLTEAERRYVLHDKLVAALEHAKNGLARPRTSMRSQPINQM